MTLTAIITLIKNPTFLAAGAPPARSLATPDQTHPDESTTLDVDDIYGIITMTFAIDDQLITESTEYSDDTCSIATGETEVHAATYVLGDLLITDSGLEAQEIDITYQPPEGVSTAYGIIRSEGDILYLSEFDESTRQNSLDLTAPYSKN